MRSLPGTLDSSSFEALPQLNKTQPVHNRIASFFVVSQCCKPPGLKSDILGGNYLPKAATSRFIAYLVQSLLYYNTISFCVLQAFFASKSCFYPSSSFGDFVRLNLCISYKAQPVFPHFRTSLRSFFFKFEHLSAHPTLFWPEKW